MVTIFTVPRLPTLDARLPSAPTWQDGRLAALFDKLAIDPAPPTRALVMAAIAAAGPALGDQVVLRQGHGRQQTVEAGMLVGRYPAGFLLCSLTGRRFVKYLDLWSADAVFEWPEDAVARIDAVLTALRQRMPRPRRWGAVVMRRAQHHP